MTLPRTAAQVLSGHVRLEVRCIDRVLLTFRQPRLQYGQGIHGFFCHHRGHQFVSSALMRPMTEQFAADIRHYIDVRGLDLVRFAKGQSKDQIARTYLAGHDGGEQLLFAGVAQEKTRVWRTRQRTDPVTGKRYPWLCQEQAMVNHWYFYGFDADFGPFYVKFCGYFPYTGQIYLNGHEYAKRQCLKAGIGFTALDNAFGSADDPAAVQRICDGLTDQRIYRFAGKWLARLPHPFTRDDEDAGYRWQLSVQQIEFSTTMALDRPVCGRIFFEQLIRDNLDIGRPDKVNIVFDRKVRLRGKNPAPGTFRTQVITSGACPYLYLYYKKTQVKQYLKEGRALRTETTLNQPRDFGIGKELTNLAAMAEVGYSASRRLLDAECISHDPADGAAALEAITSPVISTTCTRIPGMRFPDPRVQALLGACCALALRPAGFTSRDLRHYLAPQLGTTPEDMTGGQISYDLRRLRDCQLIERIPHSRAYQVTEDGLSIALFLTRLTQRLLIPGLAQLTSPGPPGRSPLRQADRAYRDALTDLARQASLAALRNLQLSPAVITSQHAPVLSRHTRRNLTRNSKSLRGKITYRAEKAAEALHSQVRHCCIVLRDGHPQSADVTQLVPGDVVDLQLGEVVPADLRLLAAAGLECEESVLTGESLPADKSTDPVPDGTPLAELSCCALMGTVVHAGSGTGVVVATGGRAEFGRIALGLGERQPETEFQIGLRKFSMLLVQVAGVLTGAIFVINVALHRPVIDALLFSLAIAVGISPQLLPAVVSTSLAAGSRQLARRKVLVKRLVCIEDLGDIEVLFTDKTGTLTEGSLRFMRSSGPDGRPGEEPLLLGLLCNEAVVEDGHAAGGNALDVALWDSPAAAREKAALARYRRLATLPFDHDRRAVSVLVEDDTGSRVIITKGAPEGMLERCADVPAAARTALDAEFAAGNRVVAVASRAAPGQSAITAADEHGLEFRGLLVFLDPPKATARRALDRLAGLGVTVKVLTGDNPAVAAKVCADLGLPPGRVMTGADIDAADDAGLDSLLGQVSVFARVSPEHKAAIVRAQRRTGVDVAFLGDGVNDAIALHAADVGISVESATDVAKDAADVLLLEKDLDVLADGVMEGRRIFTNTMKYVLMGTSSNFGNMFSAAGASLFLGFLPMLPSQILLNNLLYDSSQMAIPTDNVDPEQVARPSRWDVGLIRRFMLFFGPISSLFDFATFGVMLWVFHAGPALFRSGWFVESLATQTLVIFAIRTRRIPFFRSHPSLPLLLAALGVVTVGAVLPATPLARALGFQPLPGLFYLALTLMVASYLVLIEIGKRWFYRTVPPVPASRSRTPYHRLLRRAARFTTASPARLPRPVPRQ